MKKTKNNKHYTNENHEAIRPGRSIKWAITSIFILLAFVLVCAIGEIFFRFYVFGLDALSFLKLNSVASIKETGLIMDSEIREILYELKPNLNKYFKTVKFQTNSRGMRDKEYSLKKPTDTFRVAVVGDSYTMASGVEIKNAYHTIIEDGLNKFSTDITFEFINFGVGGYSLSQYVAVIEHKVLPYNPDLILIGFCSNNDSQPTKIDYFIRSNDRKYKSFVGQQKSPFFSSFLLDYVIRKAVRKTLKSMGFLPSKISQKKSEFDKKYAKEYVNNNFLLLATICRKNNIPILVAYLPYKTGNSRQIRNIARLHGLHFVDASAPFNGTDKSQYYIYKIDHHPNSKAHKLFADAINEYITHKGLVPFVE